MKNYEWKSDFSPLINDFLEQYRLAGFKYESFVEPVRCRRV